MSNEDRSLIERMRALADAGHERAVDLREKAKALEMAVENFHPMRVLGAWSRARKLWCEITGESLV